MKTHKVLPAEAGRRSLRSLRALRLLIAHHTA